MELVIDKDFKKATVGNFTVEVSEKGKKLLVKVGGFPLEYDGVKIHRRNKWFDTTSEHILVPFVEGTLYLNLELNTYVVSGDDGDPDQVRYGEWDDNVYIVPKLEDDFMCKWALDRVWVRDSLFADQGTKWHDKPSNGRSWNYVLTDGVKGDLEKEELGWGTIHRFNLDKATWVIVEDRGFNQCSRIMYTTVDEWWLQDIKI